MIVLGLLACSFGYNLTSAILRGVDGNMGWTLTHVGLAAASVIVAFSIAPAFLDDDI